MQYNKPTRPAQKECNTGQAYRPDIDGLRAIAILSVVAFHAFPTVMQGGFVGVDIFFVISGFLISNIIFGGLRRGEFSFAVFYAHRVKRIFPALIVVLAACYCFACITLLPDEFKQLGKHMAAGAGFVQNFALWQEAGYFDTASELKPLMHLWSLGIEEQFYLIYPLLIWMAWRLGLNALMAIMLLGLVSFGLNVSEIENDAVWTFFAPQTRFWELMAGSLLAYLQLFPPLQFVERLKSRVFHPLLQRLGVPPSRRDAALGNLLSACGLLVIAVAVTVIDKGMRFPGYWALLPVAGAFLSILAGPSAWVNRRILASGFMVWVGVISYPLYLWHWPVLSFAWIMESEIPPGEIRMAAVALSFGLAWLTYRLLERPIRAGQATWLKTAGLTAMLAAVGYIGYDAFERNGVEIRLEVIERMQAILSGESPVLPRVMLLGDSHAGHFAAGLREELGLSLADYSSPGCIPFYNVDRYDSRFKPGACRAVVNKALELFEKSESMETIILASMGPVYLTGIAFKGQDQARVTGLGVTLASAPDLTDRWEVYRVGMRNTLSRLSATNKQVIFVLDNPELGFNPNTACIDNQGFRARKVRSPCAVSRKEFDERSRDYRRMVIAVLKEFPQVQVFDTAEKLCDRKWCWAMRDGKLLYKDFDHLSVDGSRYMAQTLLPIIRRNTAEKS